MNHMPRRSASFKGCVRWMLVKLREFLEIIGLREAHQIENEEQLSRFRLYHTEFRKLLSANNSFLETTADLERKALGREFFDRAYVRRKAVRAVTDVHRMVDGLNAITGDRYAGLTGPFDSITRSLTTMMGSGTGSDDEELVLGLDVIRSSHADVVGGKMANLGELRNRLGLPVPEGFATTTAAFRLLLEEGGILSAVQDDLMGALSTTDVVAVSETVRRRIMDVSVPPRLEAAILDAYDRLAERLDGSRRLAVRSSALGEDGERSFAGQFLTVLNVSRDGLLDAYLRVVASLHSPEAIHYRMLQGMPNETAQMAVGFIAMVDAAASGIMFSVDPARGRKGEVLIHVLRGLGLRLADGSSSAERIQVEAGAADRGEAIRRISIRQTERVVLGSDGALVEEPVSAEEAAEQCLTDERAGLLARWARQLESHFGRPQDIEWALDPQGNLLLLQSRPLVVSSRQTFAQEPVPGFPVLLKGGEVACPGIGAGPAFHVDDDGNMDAFPRGAILVTRRPSPKFVRIMDKASAIVTDAGSTTGHMASLAREFRIPTLLGTQSATRVLRDGLLITVDAGSGFVYEGEVPDLRSVKPEIAEALEAARRPEDSPELRFLQEALKMIAPLHLTDPRSPEFTPENCRTLHDVTRYVHEKSYEEMFRMGEKLGDFRSASFYLEAFLPMELYIVDLGGGLKTHPTGRRVRPDQVASVPLSALLRGMLDQRIQRFGPKPMDLGGFLSIMMRHALTSPEQERTFRDPCYAIISDRYLNFTARVGYHFGVVDSHCGHTPNKNYISFHFKGGAADMVRRRRRVHAIAGILREQGFSLWLKDDIMNARFGKATRDETSAKLEMLGRLMQFFRQMDVAMNSDDSIAFFMDAFLNGKYDLIAREGR